MKLLLYSHCFAPSIGGVESQVLLLAQGLSRPGATPSAEGLEVTVVTNTPAAGQADADYPFRVLRRPGWFQLAREIRQADTVHLAGPVLLPLAICLLLRKPAVIEHHGYQSICPNGLVLRQPDRVICEGRFQQRKYNDCLRCLSEEMSRWQAWKNLLLMFPRRYLSKKATSNVCITHHVMQRLDLPASQVIYYGIREASEPSSPLPAISPPLENGLSFGYVGRLVREKGLPLVLQAAKQLQSEGYKFHIKFVGDGPERQKLEALADELGLKGCVEFTGFFTGDLLQAAVRNIAVVLMPSICEETAGLAAIEQMMRGKLVIASNVGGLGEVVDDCGLRFPPGDLEELTRCMRMVLDHPEIIQGKGHAAKERALNYFSQQRMVKDHVALYAQLLSPSNNTSSQTAGTGSSNR